MWIKTEENKLINLDQVNLISIETSGWKKKSYNLNADLTLIKTFQDKTMAEKELNFLFQKLDHFDSFTTLEEIRRGN